MNNSGGNVTIAQSKTFSTGITISRINFIVLMTTQSSPTKIIQSIGRGLRRQNKNEIIGNEFSRDKRYDEISRIEENCAELLTQANASIVKYLKEELDYKNYEKNVKDIQMWSIRQQILMRLLAEIGDLRYVLANGNETSKSAHSQYNKCLKFFLNFL